VFRTYNASIVLDQLLHKESASETVDEKKGDYDRANKEARARGPRARRAPRAAPVCRLAGSAALFMDAARL
jgi:hypothetical protein